MKTNQNLTKQAASVSRSHTTNPRCHDIRIMIRGFLYLFSSIGYSRNLDVGQADEKTLAV